MTAQEVDTHEVVAPEVLKILATANGPCFTAVILLPDPSQVEIQVRNAIRGLEQKLERWNLDRRAVSDLIAPIRDLATTAKDRGIWGHALILFRSPAVFRYFLLRGQFQEMHAVEERFLVRPLLQTLAHETQFHLLALSQRNVRLLHCTQHGFEPVTMREFPHSLEDYLNNRQPDHRLASRSSAGPSAGGMKGVTSGMNTDREREDRYLRNFFTEVDKGVTAHVRGQGGPLVLAGVEYEVAIYRRVNRYKQTLEQTVHGSPDGMTDNALHARAMDAVMSTYSEPVQKMMAEIRELAGTAQASTDPRAIVQAAFQGRVMDLVIAANAEVRGAWNEQTQEAEAGGSEELLNAAALETIRHGGRAFVLNEADMPVKSAAAAVFRF